MTIARTDAGEISRIERWEGGDFIQQGWDGVEQWATLNGEPLGVGYKDYDQVPYVSGDVQYWISLPYKLRDNGVNVHDRGVDGGRLDRAPPASFSGLRSPSLRPGPQRISAGTSRWWCLPERRQRYDVGLDEDLAAALGHQGRLA